MGVHTWGGCVHAWDVHWVLGDTPPPRAPLAPSLSSGCFEGMMGEKELVLPSPPPPMPATSAPTSASGRAACLSRKGVWGWCSLLPCHQTLDMDAGSRMEQPQVAAYGVEHSPTDMVIPSGCPVPQGTGLHSPHVQNPSHSPSACSYTQCTPTHTLTQPPACSAQAHIVCTLSLCTLTPRHTLLGQRAPPCMLTHAPICALPLHTQPPVRAYAPPIHSSHAHMLLVQSSIPFTHSPCAHPHITCTLTHPLYPHTPFAHTPCAHSHIPYTLSLCIRTHLLCMLIHPTHIPPVQTPHSCTLIHSLRILLVHIHTHPVHTHAIPIHTFSVHAPPLCMLMHSLYTLSLVHTHAAPTHAVPYACSSPHTCELAPTCPHSCKTPWASWWEQIPPPQGQILPPHRSPAQPAAGTGDLPPLLMPLVD